MEFKNSTHLLITAISQNCLRKKKYFWLIEIFTFNIRDHTRISDHIFKFYSRLSVSLVFRRFNSSAISVFFFSPTYGILLHPYVKKQNKTKQLNFKYKSYFNVFAIKYNSTEITAFIG